MKNSDLEPSNLNYDSPQLFRPSCSPMRLNRQIETLESKLSRLKPKLDGPIEPENVFLINKLGLLYVKQGFQSFQQNKLEKAELYFSKAKMLIKDMPVKKKDPFIFLEVTLAQTLGNLYRNSGQDQLALQELSRFFERKHSHEFLASNPSLISAGIEPIYIMYSVLCLKNGKIGPGYSAITQGIEFLEFFLRIHPWTKLDPGKREEIITKRKGNLALLYSISAKFQLEFKPLTLKTLELSIGQVIKAITLSREVNGENSPQTFKYQRQLEGLKRKMEFERTLLCEPPSGFREFCQGLSSTRSENFPSGNPQYTKSMEKTKATEKFLRFQKKNSQIPPNGFSMIMGLHRRNLTTLSTTSNSTLTQTPKTLHFHLSSLEVPEKRNLSDFLTKRPNSSHIAANNNKTDKKISLAVHMESNPKISSNQPTFKAIPSISTPKTTICPELVKSRISRGQVLKHSISMKKSSPEKMNKDRRFSERMPLCLEEKKSGGLSIFGRVKGIEEDENSIIGSLSEHSESENEESLDNSTSKFKSSMKDQPMSNNFSAHNTNTNNNNTPKNMAMSTENPSMKYSRDMQSSIKPRFMKKQTLEIPFLSRSRSKESKELGSSGNASSNSIIKEDEHPKLNSEIKRVKTEIMDPEHSELIKQMKAGENSAKNIGDESLAANKFTKKVFKMFFLKKFNKLTREKIKEIEETDSPILRVIEDMRVFPLKSKVVSNLSISDLEISSHMFPVRFYDQKGYPMELISVELLLFAGENRSLIALDQKNGDSLLTGDCFLVCKVVFRDFNFKFGFLVVEKAISEITSEKKSGLELALSMISSNDTSNLGDFLIELRENLKDCEVQRNCNGRSIKMQPTSNKNQMKLASLMKEEKKRVYKLATERNTSLKDYLRVRGLEKVIVNPDVSIEFSNFFSNFSDKLPKLTNLTSVFSPSKKVSLKTRTLSLKTISFLPKKANFIRPIEYEKPPTSNNIPSTSNQIPAIPEKKPQPEPCERKESPHSPGTGSESQSSSPHIKDGISSIREIHSQGSFVSRIGKKNLGILPSHNSVPLPSSDPILLSQKDLKPKFPLESSPDIILDDENKTNNDPLENSLDKIVKKGYMSPRRKTMQYHSKNLNFPTIQSLFNLEDIEGSPKKMTSPGASPVKINTNKFAGFTGFVLQKAEKEKESMQKIEEIEQMKNSSIVSNYLCNNPEFVERFFNFAEIVGGRYKRKETRGNGFGVFPEKPFDLDNERKLSIGAGVAELALVLLLRKPRVLIEMRIGYFEKQGVAELEKEETMKLIDSVGLIFKVIGKESSVLKVSPREGFHFMEEKSILSELIHFLRYKRLARVTSYTLLKDLSYRISLDSKFNPSLNLRETIIRLSKKNQNKYNEQIPCLSNFNPKGYYKPIDLTSIKRVYMHFRLRGSQKYLRIESFASDGLLRLSFYDPLQGRKDYCLVSQQQKIELLNISRVINQVGSKLKERILAQNLTYIQELVGKKLYVFKQYRQDLETVIKNRQKAGDLKLALLVQEEDETLRNFFIKRVLYEVYKIKNLGKCYIKISVYSPNKHFYSISSENRTLYKLEIYPLNKRFSLQKLIFTSHDFPSKDPLSNERSLLNHVNHLVLNRAIYIKTMLYRRLLFPKTEEKYRGVSFVEEVRFHKHQIWTPKESKEEIDCCFQNDDKDAARFLELHCIGYRVFFQAIKKLAGLFTIVTFKKHMLMMTWSIELYFPRTNRVLTCYVREFDSCLCEMEAAQSVKTWGNIMKRIRLAKIGENYLLCIGGFKGIVRESICDEILVNKHHGLIRAQWVIEKNEVKKQETTNFGQNLQWALSNFNIKTADYFRIFLKVHFLTQECVFNEKMSLREMIYSVPDLSKKGHFCQADILHILKYFTKKLIVQLHDSFHLTSFIHKAFKTHFMIEDPSLKATLKVVKDMRIVGVFDKKASVLVSKVLMRTPRILVTVLWIAKKLEFVIVVFSAGDCGRKVWRVGMREIIERAPFVEKLLEKGLKNEAGERVLAVVRNKVLIKSFLDL